MRNRLETKNTAAGLGGQPVGECFGLHWLLGDPWGLAHPDHSCYSSADMVKITGSTMEFEVAYMPRFFHNEKFYPWAVGRVHSQELFKFGEFDIWFRAPQGPGLWPAIWMYDAENWPPEIDIFEGWTGKQQWPLRRSGTYRRNLLLNNIKPGVVYDRDGESRCVSGGVAGRGTWAWWVRPGAVTHARLVWTSSEITVSYDGRRVFHLTDQEQLAKINRTNGMFMVLNTYVQDNFSLQDLHQAENLIIYAIKHMRY